MTSAPRQGAAVAVALLLVLVPATAAVSAGTAPSTAPAAGGQITQSAVDESPARVAVGSSQAQSEIDADTVLMRIGVGEDGSADWEVQYRVRLDDENATAAFESIQADIEENASAFTDQFATGMQRSVNAAENETGREMALENVTVSAERRQLPQEYGVVTYRFRWTNFAVAGNDDIRAGDGLTGLFLDGESSLVLAWPDGYATESVTPEPDERGDSSVTWHGPTDFGPNEPRLVLAPAGSGDGSGLSAGLLAGALALLVALAVAAWLIATRTGIGRSEESLFDGPAAEGAGGTAAAGNGAAPASGESEGEQEPPAELLSNEERVLRLLNGRGGRIKQQEIAREFDWTDAKTSQVVGKLRDDDEVKTFRIGRENVVALPEESEL